MKNKLLILLLVSVMAVTLTGCFKEKETKQKEGLQFKEEYEKLNGKTNKSGKAHRTISISEDNVFVEITPDKAVEMIENGDTFYLYFGSPLCPWCRSVIEKADEVSRNNGIEKIYYIDIWDEEGNEIFRDKYEIVDGELKKTINGVDSYYKMLEYFNDFLRDYEITTNAGDSMSTGEKRIYAPNFVYINKGKIARLVTGKSSLQNDSREELTDEMLKEEETIFNEFFVNACDDAC